MRRSFALDKASWKQLIMICRLHMPLYSVSSQLFVKHAPAIGEVCDIQMNRFTGERLNLWWKWFSFFFVCLDARCPYVFLTKIQINGTV